MKNIYRFPNLFNTLKREFDIEWISPIRREASVRFFAQIIEPKLSKLKVIERIKYNIQAEDMQIEWEMSDNGLPVQFNYFLETWDTGEELIQMVKDFLDIYSAVALEFVDGMKAYHLDIFRMRYYWENVKRAAKEGDMSKVSENAKNFSKIRDEHSNANYRI